MTTTEPITLILDVSADDRHEHGIGAFIIHLTRETATSLVTIAEAVKAIGQSPAFAPHLAGRGVAGIALAEPPDSLGYFTSVNHSIRAARHSYKQAARGVSAIPHTTGLNRPSGVSNRHLYVSPTSVWWSATAGLRAGEVTTALVPLEILREIADGKFIPQSNGKVA